MYLDQETKTKLENIYQSFLNHPLILKMKEIPMHRGSNCYIHSFKVAKASIKKATKKNKGYNLEALLVGAILHDYYLYDWRSDRDKLKGHGKNHPIIASENARRDFDISREVAEIIKTHMWPLTPKLKPITKEAKLLDYMDDKIATIEFFSSKKYKTKRETKYLQEISHLFDE